MEKGRGHGGEGPLLREYLGPWYKGKGEELTPSPPTIDVSTSFSICAAIWVGGRVWTVSGEGGEGVDCEWGRRGGCGL